MLCAGCNSSLDSQIAVDGIVSRRSESGCAVVARKRGGASRWNLGCGLRIVNYHKTSSFAFL